MQECMDYCHVNNLNIDYIKYIYNTFNVLPKKIEGRVIRYISLTIDLERNILLTIDYSKNNLTFVKHTLNYKNIRQLFQ